MHKLIRSGTTVTKYQVLLNEAILYLCFHKHTHLITTNIHFTFTFFIKDAHHQHRMILFVWYCKGSLASCLCQCTYLLIFTYYDFVCAFDFVVQQQHFVLVCVSVCVSQQQYRGLLRINMGALLVASLAC